MTTNTQLCLIVGGVMGMSRAKREMFETKQHAELKHELRQIQKALGTEPTRESDEDWRARLGMLPQGPSLNLWGIPQPAPPQRKPEPWEWALLWLALLGFGAFIWLLIRFCSV
jgi:hypothetical protein